MTLSYKRPKVKFKKPGADAGTLAASVYPVRFEVFTKEVAASVELKRIKVLLPLKVAFCVWFCAANWILTAVLLFHVTFHTVIVAFPAV